MESKEYTGAPSARPWQFRMLACYYRLRGFYQDFQSGHLMVSSSLLRFVRAVLAVFGLAIVISELRRALPCRLQLKRDEKLRFRPAVNDRNASRKDNGQP
jgi:hypothetical protein